MATVSPHGGAIAESKNFQGKVTNNFPDTQELSAKDNLIAIVSNPTEPERSIEEVGMLRIKTANQWAQDAALRPNPRKLWLSLWHEGELCCLFSDSNLGKSIYAVQIASEIAKTDKILYADFELSDKQFQLRYCDENGNLHQFPANFLRAEIDPDLLMEGVNFEDEVIANIEDAATIHGIKIIIVDNLTYLSNESEKGDAAGMLMMRLMQLKKKCGLSLLILAHTPKRSMTSPITQNDLAGSKKLFNFFDSVFALGRSAKDENLRYIKQVKARAGGFEYGSDNVMVAEIVKEGSWLHFQVKGCASEKEHLREQSEKEDSQFIENVRELRSKGFSIRQIADKLGVSKSKVSRVK